MPRNMSFALTTTQFKNRTKDVTRRCGWDFLQRGELLWGVEKAMGLRRGEKIKRLGLIEVVSTRVEPISAITDDDVKREGFPHWRTQEFVDFFCDHNDVDPDTIVNRIEFRYIGYLATAEMLDQRSVIGRDAEIGELVFRSTDLCSEWSCTKPFFVGARTLSQWLHMQLGVGCHAKYSQAINYYQRAYGGNKLPFP